jgi:hypothetical protein
MRLGLPLLFIVNITHYAISYFKERKRMKFARKSPESSIYPDK